MLWLVTIHTSNINRFVNCFLIFLWPFFSSNLFVWTVVVFSQSVEDEPVWFGGSF